MANLSARQREQLLDLAEIRDKGGTGTAYWRPSGAEFQTADALAKRGLLTRDFSNMSGGRVYELTNAGYAAVRA